MEVSETVDQMLEGAVTNDSPAYDKNCCICGQESFCNLLEIDKQLSQLTSKDYYFDRFARINIHEEQLKDKVRTITYRDAVMYNKHLFREKVVLDIGCGTGILAMLAAQAGASRVFAIECSRVNYAEKIILENNLNNVVTVIKGNINEITLPDGIEEVDIIISEWTGYCLFYESRLNSVLLARDKWLKADGMMFPDKASLYICAIDDRYNKSEKFNWWTNVYDFKMSSIRSAAFLKPSVNAVDPDLVFTESYRLKEIDLYTVEAEDLDFRAEFRLKVQNDAFFTGFLTFFDIEFTKCHTATGFSTAPEAPKTHWKQTAFYFEEDLFAKEDDVICGHFTLKHNYTNVHDLDISIDVDFLGDVSDMNRRLNYHMQF